MRFRNDDMHYIFQIVDERDNRFAVDGIYNGEKLNFVMPNYYKPHLLNPNVVKPDYLKQ